MYIWSFWLNIFRWMALYIFIVIILYTTFCISTGIPQSSGPLLGGAVSQAPPTFQQTTPNNALPGSTGGTPSLPGRTNMQGMTSVSL